MDLFNLAATDSLRQRGESVNRKAFGRLDFSHVKIAPISLISLLFFKVKRSNGLVWVWHFLLPIFIPPVVGSSEHL